MEITISSNQNAQFKEWKKLHKKKYRNEYGLFLVEGVKMIKEAIEESFSLKSILITERFFDINGGNKLYEQLLEKDISIYHLDPVLFKELSNTESPQGIIGILEKPQYMLQDIINRESSSIVILEEVQDPGNLGTIIRTADAAGFDGVFLSKGCVDLYNDKVLRSTMGSLFHIPIINNIDLEEVLGQLQEENYQIIGTYLKTDNYYNNIKYSNKKVIIIGNESNGISQPTVSLCTELVKIPIVGKAESLNAAIAAGILMYKAQGI